MSYNFKDHWENIYRTKSEDKVSWFQNKPYKSIELIKSLNLENNSKIIDCLLYTSPSPRDRG